MNANVFLFIGGYGILFFAAFIGMAIIRKRSRRMRPPLEFEYNRLPGESLSKRLEKNTENLLWRFLLSFATPLAGVIVVFAGFYFAYPNVSSPVLYTSLGLAFLIALAIACWSLVDACLRNARIEQGLHGERIVADFLRPLEREGWRVFHDVPAHQNGKDFNLDHVAIGPNGVALVETKTRSKEKAIEGRKDYLVSFDGKQLLWPWGTSTSELEQLKRQREWLENWIFDRTGITVPVSPILVIPGWWTETTVATARTKVTNHKTVCQAIQGNGKETLDPKTIDLLSRQLESLCRIKA